MRLQQGRMDDACLHLESALKANAENYLLHYYYAFALSKLNLNEHRTVSSYPDEVAATMRRELTKTIALKPDYPESYWLLGFVNLVRNEEIDESIDLLQNGLDLTGGNQRVLFMLAQLYLHKEKFAEARRLLTPIAESSSDTDLRNQAATMGDVIRRAEEQRAQILELLKQQGPVGISDQPNNPTMSRASEPPGDDPGAALTNALQMPRPGESRIQGTLASIDCNAKGIMFQVRAGDRQLKFHTDDFAHMIFRTFTAGLGREITCGPRQPENSIVLTYASPKAGTKIDGEASAIEFVPHSFVLKQ